MHFRYLPTIDYPLWPCVGAALLLFVPITIWHERAWRRTILDYGAARRAAGATDPWPPEGMAALLGMQPWLLLVSAGLLAVMTGLGLASLVAWPGKVPFFDEPLNYFDRPYVAIMVVIGTAVVAAAVAVGVDLARSKWALVARTVRLATHARPETRERLFAAALHADPGVRRARELPDSSLETAASRELAESRSDSSDGGESAV